MNWRKIYRGELIILTLFLSTLFHRLNGSQTWTEQETQANSRIYVCRKLLTFLERWGLNEVMQNNWATPSGCTGVTAVSARWIALHALLMMRGAAGHSRRTQSRCDRRVLKFELAVAYWTDNFGRKNMKLLCRWCWLSLRTDVTPSTLTQLKNHGSLNS